MGRLHGRPKAENIIEETIAQDKDFYHIDDLRFLRKLSRGLASHIHGKNTRQISRQAKAGLLAKYKEFVLWFYNNYGKEKKEFATSKRISEIFDVWKRAQI